MKHEYHEGPEVLEKFKALMAQAFQAPKSSTPFARPKKATKKAARVSAKRSTLRKSGKAGD
jgi:hypothetical protein